MLSSHTRSCLEASVQYHFSAILGRDADGYWARCPELQGCYVQGDTHEEALDHLREAVALHVEDRLACGEEIPRVETISLIMVEVSGGGTAHSREAWVSDGPPARQPPDSS
jgi:predicted RNase H-like HicB family nuclease